MRGDEPVTAHAVLRWLTRVQDLTIEDIVSAAPNATSEPAMAFAGCSLLNLTMADARQIILPRHLRPALDLGCTRIFRPGFTLVCSDRVVVTVVEPHQRTNLYRLMEAQAS